MHWHWTGWNQCPAWELWRREPGGFFIHPHPHPASSSKLLLCRQLIAQTATSLFHFFAIKSPGFHGLNSSTCLTFLSKNQSDLQDDSYFMRCIAVFPTVKIIWYEAMDQLLSHPRDSVQCLLQRLEMDWGPRFTRGSEQEQPGRPGLWTPSSASLGPRPPLHQQTLRLWSKTLAGSFLPPTSNHSFIPYIFSHQNGEPLENS